MENRIKRFREKKNITQDQLARFLNVRITTISNYENGRREPDLMTISKIADYLEVTIDDLLGRGIENQVSLSKEELEILNKSLDVIKAIVERTKK